MHDDSLEKQNLPAQGAYGTQPAVADLQASALACNRVVHALRFTLGLYPHEAIEVHL